MPMRLPLCIPRGVSKLYLKPWKCMLAGAVRCLVLCIKMCMYDVMAKVSAVNLSAPKKSSSNAALTNEKFSA